MYLFICRYKLFHILGYFLNTPLVSPDDNGNDDGASGLIKIFQVNGELANLHTEHIHSVTSLMLATWAARPS